MSDELIVDSNERRFKCTIHKNTAQYFVHSGINDFCPLLRIMSDEIHVYIKSNKHKMKTIKKFIRPIVVAVTGVILLTNCTKEPEKSNILPTPSQRDLKIITLVKDFKSKMNSKLKNEENVSIDSAIWYLEAALNLTYARADKTRDVINLDSAKVTVPISENYTISITDIALVYDKLVDSLSLHYHSISGEKGVVVTDISLAGEGVSEVLIKMTDIITTNSATGLFDFGPDDYWVWGFGMGKCNGTLQPWDASSKLTQHANADGCILPISCYTSVEKSPDIYPTDVPVSPPNPFGYGDYLLFEKSGLYPVVHQCLSPDAMNYYLASLKTIANMYKPTAKNIIKYYCSYDIIVNEDYWMHVHYAQITYGVPILVSDPPEDL